MLVTVGEQSAEDSSREREKKTIISVSKSRS